MPIYIGIKGSDFVKCEFEYCIYNRNFGCILNGTEINSLGLCASSIIVTLDADFLDEAKERQLQEIEARWQQWN